jgi:hypothetical protein
MKSLIVPALSGSRGAGINSSEAHEVRLAALSRGGGRACKVDSPDLAQALRLLPSAFDGRFLAAPVYFIKTHLKTPPCGRG